MICLWWCSAKFAEDWCLFKYYFHFGGGCWNIVFIILKAIDRWQQATHVTDRVACHVVCTAVSVVVRIVPVQEDALVFLDSFLSWPVIERSLEFCKILNDSLLFNFELIHVLLVPTLNDDLVVIITLRTMMLEIVFSFQNAVVFLLVSLLLSFQGILHFLVPKSVLVPFSRSSRFYVLSTKWCSIFASKLNLVLW